MHHTLFHFLRTFVADYGYWAVALALLCESAGIPLPGEITLLFASFLANSEHKLHFGWIIVVATCASTLGGDLGFAIGRYGGRALLDRYQRVLHISAETLTHGENVIRRHGAAAIFVARFIFGLRTFAGPIAGVLGMRWQIFALFNFLGAAIWVVVIACAGYFLGQNWPWLVSLMQRFNLAAAVLAIAAALFLWWRRRRTTH